MRSQFARQAVRQPSRARLKSYPAPVRGWVSGANLANAPSQSCHTLENWFPTKTGLRQRLGFQKVATIGSSAVQSILTYEGGGVSKLFAADAGNIFNITTVADPAVPPVADITGQTSGYYSFQNFASTGGNTMTVANGTNNVRQYDGTTWSTPALTNLGPSGASTDTSVLDHVWAYRNRIWLTEKNTMRAYALAVGAIAGAAVLVDLAGVFAKGGSLKSGATWSLDAGDGLDDKIVFFSTEGEAAVYEGSNPADPNDWRLVGVYSIPKLLGKRSTIRFGGEVFMATEKGLIPISVAINIGRPAVGLAAKSADIEPDWLADAAARRSLPWEMVEWPARNMLMVNVPVTGTSTPAWCYVTNTETGAWAKYTGWDTRCLGFHEEYVYFGTNAGTVMQAEITGADDGAIYTSTMVMNFVPMGVYHTVKQARALFRRGNEIAPQVSVSRDYSVSLPVAPNAAAISASPGVWDVGLWDVALWDTGAALSIYNTLWVAIGLSADFAFAPQIQLTSGQETASVAELIQLDLTFEGGGVVV